MGAATLGTLQRNVLSRFYGRKDFSPQDVAGLSYAQLEQLPGIGPKGIAAIRTWLWHYGYDIENPPTQHNGTARKRLRMQLDRAEQLLLKHGYFVIPPS